MRPLGHVDDVYPHVFARDRVDERADRRGRAAMTTDHSRQVVRVDNHVERHAATPCTLRHAHIIRVADDRADQELHGVVNHGLLLLVEDALDLVIAVAGVTLGDLDLNLGALV